MILKMLGNLAAPKLFSAATLFCLVLVPEDLFGQTRRTILGQVSDPSGVAVPTATVIATNTGTRLTRKGGVNAQCSYIMPALPIGKYKLKVLAPSFKKVTQTGIALQVGQNAHLAVFLVNLPLIRFDYISDFQDNSHSWGEYAFSGRAVKAFVQTHESISPYKKSLRARGDQEGGVYTTTGSFSRVHVDDLMKEVNLRVSVGSAQVANRFYNSAAGPLELERGCGSEIGTQHVKYGADSNYMASQKTRFNA